MRSLLVIAPARVGEVVVAQGLFKLAKASDPGCVVDVVAPGRMLPLLARMPEVRHAMAMPAGQGGPDNAAARRLLTQLRDRDYDQAIVLPDTLESVLLPFRAGIPLRTGYGGLIRRWLLNDCRRLDRRRLPQTVQRFAALGLPVAHTAPLRVPYPVLVSRQEDQDAVAKRLGVSSHYQPALALCPGGGPGPAARWPAGHYAAIARNWLEKGWHVWLFGTAEEATECDRINALADNRCHNLAGRTRLEDTIDLLAMSAFVVCNDSGLMHVAAALQRPMVAIFGASDPGCAPPLSETAQVERLGLKCSPCGRRRCPLGHLNCLRQLSPERIMRAMEEVMKR